MGIVRPLVAIAAVGAVAWVGFGRLGGEVNVPGLPQLPASPAAAPVLVSEEAVAVAGATGDDSLPGDNPVSPERQFASALDAASAQARELVRLGETKSRNLPGILSEQRRMNARLDEIDALIASGTLPSETDDAVAAYADGAGAVRDAMDKAQNGLLKLDFGMVASATARMRDGERDLSLAAGLLRD